MSLKAFHIFFITLSVALAFGFGLWAVDIYSKGRAAADLALALVSFAGGGALAAYEVKAIRRFRRIG